ncbi:hypothetical protein [Corynebacterium stationis]|uniref:hypothetical protein n=1 Tax=Corynebacterium stationis TaxID=1705 RepID=UPI00076F955D|nr:hypothetical protein [Corynebacterium stationis]AMJ43672.1 hypothetical protein AW169_01160 [Corynebacterium stationis]AQX70119.1 hypothetical protein CA21670_00285 [Corynebacterium stationis]ASJ17823.1 hypothetical protein BA700_01160 [Corynebacterium stationis]HJG64015.1 hypothetical protein [Corynebacterium stationis]
MIEQPTVQRTISLRDVANRLGDVLEAIVTQQDGGIDDARKLLEQLHEVLPRESFLELTEDEILTMSGSLVEVIERQDLGIFLIQHPSQDLHGLVLMSATRTVESIPLGTIYPRWELPSIFPAEGINRTTTRINREILTLDEATPEENNNETKPQSPPTPQKKTTPSAPGKEEFVPVTEEEFYELPNKSLVRVIDRETGQEVVGTRTRKGRWALSTVARPVNDAEAWETLLDSSEDDEVYWLVSTE